MPTRVEPTIGDIDVAFVPGEPRRLDQPATRAHSADWPGRVFVLVAALVLPVAFVAWAWTSDALGWSADPAVAGWKRALVTGGYLVVGAVQLASAVLAFGQRFLGGLLSLLVPWWYLVALRRSGVYPVVLLVLIAGLAATIVGTIALR